MEVKVHAFFTSRCGRLTPEERTPGFPLEMKLGSATVFEGLASEKSLPLSGTDKTCPMSLWLSTTIT